ncbi:MAG: hypothetical protein KC413_08625 [Anaerolineales bacterium]|nr:hypothetical protein [Anaerolineales bacterium]
MHIDAPGTHIDHLLRQTRMHHTQLSAMADVKANILLTLASLMITFSIRYLSEPYLKWPVLVLILFCLATVVAAAYAVMPKLDFKHRPNVENPECNILFFGSFMNLDYDEYVTVMERVINDPALVYETQVREVYELGVFLARKKYRFIRLGYMIFITGLIVSGLVFGAIELFIVLNP